MLEPRLNRSLKQVFQLFARHLYLFVPKYVNSLITRGAFRAVKSLVCSVGSTVLLFTNV